LQTRREAVDPALRILLHLPERQWIRIGLRGHQPLAFGDLILTKVLEGFAYERDLNATRFKRPETSAQAYTNSAATTGRKAGTARYSAGRTI